VGDQNQLTVNVTADQVFGFSAGAARTPSPCSKTCRKGSAGNATASPIDRQRDVASPRQPGSRQIGSAGTRIEEALALNSTTPKPSKSQLSAVQE